MADLLGARVANKPAETPAVDADAAPAAAADGDLIDADAASAAAADGDLIDWDYVRHDGGDEDTKVPPATPAPANQFDLDESDSD